MSRYVPEELTEPVSTHLLAMRGTDQLPPRCVALEGQIGNFVGCSIYDRRPSACRTFQASFEDGERNVRCDEARAAIGLKPLDPASWVTRGVPSPSKSPEIFS